MMNRVMMSRIVLSMYSCLFISSSDYLRCSSWSRCSMTVNRLSLLQWFKGNFSRCRPSLQTSPADGLVIVLVVTHLQFIDTVTTGFYFFLSKSINRKSIQLETFNFHKTLNLAF